MQLSHVVSPNIMFGDYVYIPSTSKTLINHFAELANKTVEKFNLPEGSLVVDIGSNDGTLLKFFKIHKVKVLGIEPATNIAKLAEASGIETINDFFGQRTALKVVDDKGKAKVITGTNVFAHVNDLDDFLKGIDILLEDNGIFIIEVPYLPDLLEKIEFDTIYHEHLSYFSIKPLATLFEKFKMEIFDVERIGIHGGSIRVFVKRASAPGPVSESVTNLLALEQERGLDSIETYLTFATEVASIKERLIELLKRLKSEGKRIVGYGAAAKGNILLNYCKIGTDILDYIVDNIPYKQGRYTPGMHIPVVPEERITQDRPDYALILAWNFAKEIMAKQQKYRELGGQFILPIPNPQII
jgi:SAM-dependent methyltransferase